MKRFRLTDPQESVQAVGSLISAPIPVYTQCYQTGDLMIHMYLCILTVSNAVGHVRY